ncbi:MAG TPA: hypothetical protein VGE74_05400 [Gemmata sp.]
MLRATQYDPDASRGFELMTASFIWSDERGGVPGNLPSIRALFGFRGSLQCGQPDESLREAWDQLLAACPEWPGFRPERCSSALRGDWEREYGAWLRHLDPPMGGEPAEAEPTAAPDPTG